MHAVPYRNYAMASSTTLDELYVVAQTQRSEEIYAYGCAGVTVQQGKLQIGVPAQRSHQPWHQLWCSGCHMTGSVSTCISVSQRMLMAELMFHKEFT